MLEKVDMSKSLSKEEYKEVFEPLQLRLAALQREVADAGIPVAIIFEGWEAAGKGSCIGRLVHRLDPRGFNVHAISAPDEEEFLSESIADLRDLSYMRARAAAGYLVTGGGIEERRIQIVAAGPYDPDGVSGDVSFDRLNNRRIEVVLTSEVVQGMGSED